jgi:hypothetical protein
MILVRPVTTWVLGAGLLLWLGACDGPLYSRSLDGGANSIDALHIGVAPDGFPVATAADSGGSPIGVGGTGAGLESRASKSHAALRTWRLATAAQRRRSSEFFRMPL